MFKNFRFWDVFDRTPVYKERERFDTYSREALIDALIAQEETITKNAKESSDYYDKTVEKFTKDAKDTARATAIATEDTERKHNQTVADLKQAHKVELAELKQAHTFELETIELQDSYSDDGKVKKAEERAVEAEKNLAVALAEKAILETMIDLNGDIVDIKDMANKIIDKLPTITLTSLPSAAPAPKQEKKDKEN